MNTEQSKMHMSTLHDIREKLEEVRCGLVDVETALGPQEIDTTEWESKCSGEKVMEKILEVLKNIQYNTDRLRG